MSQSDSHKVFVPWVEKYRPKSVDQVLFQEEVVKVLKKCILGQDFPNLLFYGPPGTGKTSTILALAHEMFKDMFSSRVLELNASDERGILVIREKVKRFAQQSASGVKMSGEKCPPFKIIILDEADCMTSYAQSCLRRIMEKETKSTRFCIICNYITRIIDPIVSRCSKFRFKPLHQDIVISKLESICENESIKLENDQVLLELIKVSNGDLRKAITFLQTTYRLKGFEEALSVDDIREVSGFIPKRWIKSLIKACENQSHENVEQVLNNIIAEGFAGNQLVLQLHDWVISDKCQLSDSKISVICEAIASTDHCLLEGANEFLQLFHLASIILQQMEN